MKQFIQLKGELFERVQIEEVFPDSKTFVDSSPAFEHEIILDKYKNEKNKSSFALKEFVKEAFILTPSAGGDLNLDKNRTMEEHISALWNILLRGPDKKASSYSTLLPLPYPYIVPGGRFTEVYYWDSYFTSEGLAASGKMDIVENMVKNFAYLIDNYGHIPNGNRVYYLSRSQPPFFCSMVNILFKNKGIEAIEAYLPALEKEYCFWMDGEHAVKIDDIKLNRYWDDNPIPREESYREDLHLCKKADPQDNEAFYRNLRAGAESGWDFSSRWFKDEKDLSTIRTTEILPIDLNSIMFDMELKLAGWFMTLGDKIKAGFYAQKADLRKALIHKYFWDNEKKFFFDYCFTDKKRTNTWSLAGLYPLFFRIATDDHAKYAAGHTHEKFLCGGGLVTTINKTSQQWDSPNGWAPLQWIGFIGLRNYGYEVLANEIAKRFVNTSRNVFSRTGKMMEKYNVCDLTLEAGGGEYTLQDGFGWTNGIVSAFLDNLN